MEVSSETLSPGAFGDQFAASMMKDLDAWLLRLLRDCERRFLERQACLDQRGELAREQ